MGVAAIAPGETADPDLLIRSADEQLYRAKQHGRNRYSVADGGERPAPGIA
jgi:PleD family two-component response regulator